jgi:protein O-GlcNAc transferase
VARSVDDYVERAVALASDRPRRQALHRELRGRLGASPLMDGSRLARALEAAYREAWRRALH